MFHGVLLWMDKGPYSNYGCLQEQDVWSLCVDTARKRWRTAHTLCYIAINYVKQYFISLEVALFDQDERRLTNKVHSKHLKCVFR